MPSKMVCRPLRVPKSHSACIVFLHTIPSCGLYIYGLDGESALRSALAPGHISSHPSISIKYHALQAGLSFPLVNRLLSLPIKYFYCRYKMELCPRISCWAARIVLLLTFVVLILHQQQNVANASPLPLGGLEDYSDGKGRGLISSSVLISVFISYR